MSNSSKNSKNDFVRLSLTLFAIAAIMALLVALVNGVTSQKIADINAKKLSQALTAVYPDANEFSEVPYMTGTVQSDDGKEVAVDGVWSARRDDEFIGYCIKVSPKGYGGAIETIVAISPAGKILSSRIVSLSETSGIGTKIQSDSFLSQFDNKTRAELGGVNTISGATKSSSAYIRGIDVALKVALKVNGGEWSE